MTAFLLAIALLVGSSGAAEAGPLTPLIAAVSGWFATTFGAALGGFLLNTLASVALSALSMAIRGKPKFDQPGITTESTTRGGTVPQRLIFGRYATGGNLVAPFMVYETDESPNEWLVGVYALADKPIQGLVSIIVDGLPLTIDGDARASVNGDAMGVSVEATPGPEGLQELVFIRYHDGNQTAPDAYLRRVFAGYPDRPWTADMIGTGTAYAVVTFKGRVKDGKYTGFPSIRFVVDGHRLRDPRTGTDVFTRNPAVIAYNILRGITLPDGQVWGVGADSFILPHVIAAANLCDTAVPVASGGTRPRYQAGLEISLEDQPHEALEEILKAMGGDVADMGGTWTIKAGENGAAVYAFTDDDIIVTDSRNLRPYPPLMETVNAVHGSYPDPSQQWEAKEAVPLYNAEYEAADGGRRLPVDVNFPAVPYPMQVRALMREMLADHRKHRTHVITLPPDALGVNLGEMIAWTSEINGYVNKLFKVAAKRVDPQTLCVAFTITEHDPADYDYDADSDGELPVIPTPRPVTPIITGVPGFAAVAVTVPGDNGSRPGIEITWDDEVDARSVFWEIYRVSGDTLVSSGIERPEAGRTVVSEGIMPATSYAVRGQLVIANRTTEPGPWVYVTTADIRLGWPDLTDDVLADVNELETWINGTGDLIRQVMDEVGILRDDMVEGDADAFNGRQQIRADLDMVALDTSTALDALVVRVTDTEAGIVAQSDAITAVEARTDAATASGLFRVSAEATPAGAQTRIGLRAEATAGGATHSAAMYLDAKSDGTSQAGFVADRFWIADAPGPTATRTVPFIVAGGSVYIGNAHVRTLSLAGNAVTVPASAMSSTTVTMDTDWTTLLTLVMVREGAPTNLVATYQVDGFGHALVAFRFTRNGVEISAGYPTITGENGVQNSGAMSITDTNLGTGTTTYRLQGIRVNSGEYNNVPRVVRCAMSAVHSKR